MCDCGDCVKLFCSFCIVDTEEENCTIVEIVTAIVEIVTVGIVIVVRRSFVVQNVSAAAFAVFVLKINFM
jgi:hypothetical protein